MECPGVVNPELYKQENLDQPTVSSKAEKFASLNGNANVFKWIVRDTREQIDITKRLIAEHPEDLQYCDNLKCVREAFKAGKVASMIGIEVRGAQPLHNFHRADI